VIPGHKPKTTYAEIGMQDFGIAVCFDKPSCPKGMSWRAHRLGRVDRAGGIHWLNGSKRASRRGMRRFMKLVAMAYNRDWWTEPRYRQLFLTNIWAYREIGKRYHYRVRSEWSHYDRLQTKDAIERAGYQKTGSIRYTDRNIYAWLERDGIRVQYRNKRVSKR
jgi:hypothetical protein